MVKRKEKKKSLIVREIDERELRDIAMKFMMKTRDQTRYLSESRKRRKEGIAEIFLRGREQEMELI